MATNVIQSILSLLLISTSVSLLFSNNVIGFIKYFLFTTIIQVIFYEIYKKIMTERAEKIYNERLKEYSKQGCEVTCPCDRVCKHFIPIEMNTDNSYVCNDCDRKVIVDVQVKSFLATDPLDLEKEDEKFAEVYSRIINKIRQN